MTFRLDEVEHKMLQLLSLRTGLSQNQILTDLLRAEFERHGITRESTAALMTSPDRVWRALGTSPAVITDDVHDRVERDLAALDNEATAHAERHAA